VTPTEVLILARGSGIVLEAQGDTLIVDAPVGRLTPELRGELARHKPALLALLTTEFVYLRGGLTVPRPALELALDLERRGFTLTLDECRQFTITATAALTDEDRSSLRRWRSHLGAIVAYDVDAQKGPQ
jgi:hypothetical protein